MIILLSFLLCGVIEKKVTFSSPTFVKEGKYDIPIIEGALYTDEISYPQLLEVPIFVSIPEDGIAFKVEIEEYDSVVLAGEYEILPAQQPVIISRANEWKFTPPNVSVYNSSKLYPSSLYSELKTSTKCGYRVASFFLYPLRYIPKEKRVIFYPEIKFKLHFRKIKKEPHFISLSQQKSAESLLSKLVINPEHLPIFSPSSGVVKNPIPGYEYIIIAPNNNAWIDSLEILAKWKTKKGIPCMVKNLQEIYNEYSGSPLQWRIKQFIIEMKNQGAIWILFGADHGTDVTNSIPCMGVYAYYPLANPITYTDMPCERYYEDLDNNWNADGDAYYGEHTDGPSGGELDWLSDVYVGRLFARSLEEVGRYVRRILWYEKKPDPEFTQRAMFSSTQLVSNAYGYARTDKWASCLPEEWYIPGLGNGHYGLEYGQGVDDYPGDQDFLEDSLSQGFGFYGTAGHGNYTLFMAYNAQSIYYTEVESYFSPGMRCGIFTANSCLWGGFNQDRCCAEVLYDKGMVGGAANSRESLGHNSNGVHALYGLSDGLCLEFFQKVFEQNITNLGKAVALAKDYFVNKLGNDAWNAILKEYNTFGDPELPMWTKGEGPGSLYVVHQKVVESGIITQFEVEVKDKKSFLPITGARVCVWCKLEENMWERGYTNSDGKVILQVDPQIGLPGDTMWVTVTVQNYLPYEGCAKVVKGTPEVPTFLLPFPNQIVPSQTPLLTFVSTDPQGDDIMYEIEFDDDPYFRSSTIENTTVYGSGDTVEYTLTTTLENSSTYYFRIRAKDPTGSGDWSRWTEIRGIKIQTNVNDSYVWWWQGDEGQFSEDSLYRVKIEKDTVKLSKEQNITDTIKYDDGYVYYFTGENYYWAVRCSPTVKCSVIGGEVCIEGIGEGCSFYIWEDNNGVPGSILHGPENFYSVGGWQKIEVEPFYKETGEDFWVGIMVPGGSNGPFATCDNGSNSAGRSYFSSNGTNWSSISYNLCIRAIVREVKEYFEEGDLISTLISIEWLGGESWDRVSWKKAESSDSISLQIEYKTGSNWELIPESVLPGNSVGFFTSQQAETLEISQLSPTTYDTIRLKLNFFRGNSKATTMPQLVEIWVTGESSPTEIEVEKFEARNVDEGILLMWKGNISHQQRWVITRKGDKYYKEKIFPYNVTSYLDKKIRKDEQYVYKLGVKVDETSPPIWYDSLTMVANRKDFTFCLCKFQPNLFKLPRTIFYEIPEKQKIELGVYDVVGRMVVKLVEEVKEKGKHKVKLPPLPVGVYFLKLKGEKEIKIQKIITIK